MSIISGGGGGSQALAFTPASLAHLGIKPSDPIYGYLLSIGTPMVTTDVGGITGDAFISSGADLESYLGQLSLDGPMGAKAAAHLYLSLGLPTATNAKNYTAYRKAVWQSIVNSKFDLSKYVVPANVATGKTATVNELEIAQLSNQLIQQNQSNAQFQASYNLQKQLGYAGIAASVSQANASQQANAIDNVTQYLDRWGLGKDAPLVVAMVTKGGDHLINIQGILQAVRGEGPSGLGPAADKTLATNYENAFPGLRAYNKRFGGAGQYLTEDQYQQHISQYANTAGQFGLPTGFLSKAELGKLIEGNVSPAEFQQRMQDLYSATNNADQNVKNMLAQQHGISPSQLLSYFADPTKALSTMQRQVAQADIEDYSSRVGLSGLTQQGAGQLADMAKLQSNSGNGVLATGVGNIENSLLNASRDVNLTGHLPGASGNTVNTNQLIGSQIAGYGGTTQVAAQTAVQRAEQAKAAPFQAGGGYDETAKGVVGVGGATT